MANHTSSSFSDEFEFEKRTFYLGDGYWEAVDIWYGATNDLEWYYLKHITTKKVKLSILMESMVNHEWGGMLQIWNKFGFTGRNILKLV